MRLLFYLGHPAHFHLFKNAIRYFKSRNHEVHILIKKKDVLEDLLQNEGMEYLNIFPATRGASIYSMTKTVLKRNYRLFKYCKKCKPDLLIGTSVENSHIGKLLGIPAINVNEDDHHVVPYYSMLSYPLSNTILSPSTCTTGRWEHKTIHYSGYHELAYLHPDNFTPDSQIAAKYVEVDHPYFIIRFARLSAHHDKGIRGISDEVALKIIRRLETSGKVYITSEKPMSKKFEPYRIEVNPIDMHHVMAYADLYIGDSQTMAAEAGVLGTPFIRFNDFVGRIGYLNEMENKYCLGYGISPSNPEKLFATIDILLDLENMRAHFLKNRQKMLREKIDVNKFMIWFIENFPESKKILQHSPQYELRFKAESIQYAPSVNNSAGKREVIESKLIPLRQA